MPFVSQRQRAWMWANHPAIAEQWEKEDAKKREKVKKGRKRGAGK